MTASPGPDELARRLAQASAWADADADVEWIQTHISHVFLVGDLVYKLRKAVSLPFLDFGTRDERNADCLREVELNRRLAPSVYLGVAPIHVEGKTARVGGIADSLEEPELEHVVVMRRLTADCDALSLVDANLLRPSHLESIADLLQRFHDSHGLGRPAPWPRQEWFDRISRPILESLTTLVESRLLPEARTHSLTERIEKRLESLRPEFETRRLEGRAVDAHGDLHLDHIWFEGDDAPPLMIDCIEFNEDLRKIDRASEAAFLSMDLHYRGRPDLAEHFLSTYAGRTDDYGLFSVIDLFAAYRALVRAKVAALAAGQSTITEEQRAGARTSVEAHFSLAERLLTPAASPGILLLCGTVGCGKSTVARHLSQTGGGISIASDRVRKAMAGIEVGERVSALPDEGVYQPERVEDVYRALLDRALPVVESGRTAILDAGFAKRSHRDAARAWAQDRGLACRLIEVRCDREVTLARLREREKKGNDPSDAGPDFLAISEARFEPPDEWPAADRRIVSSDARDWASQLP